MVIVSLRSLSRAPAVRKREGTTAVRAPLAAWRCNSFCMFEDVWFAWGAEKVEVGAETIEIGAETIEIGAKTVKFGAEMDKTLS